MTSALVILNTRLGVAGRMVAGTFSSGKLSGSALDPSPISWEICRGRAHLARLMSDKPCRSSPKGVKIGGPTGRRNQRTEDELPIVDW
jgi:hypothetical protein